MITVHSGWADDFSSLGLCPLTPLECTVEEQAGGVYQLKMKHPMDDTGRWWHLQEFNIIKAPAPMRETPLISMGQTANTTVVRKVYRVRVNSRLRLRNKPSTSAGKIIGRYKNGTKVVRIGESGDWFRVVVKSGGATGWMHSDYLEYVGDETQTVTGKDTPGGIVEPRQTREQLFRIMSVERDDENACVNITARHVFYDLTGHLISGKYEPKKVAAATAAAHVFKSTYKSHDFELYSDNTAKITGEYTGRNVVSVLMETDGIVQQAKARLVRDNFDVFLLKDDERNRGVEIRHGKNMTGARLTVDVSALTTAVVPVGSDKDGNPLYLSGTQYVEAPNASEIPVVAARRIEYDVKVGKGEEDFASNSAARAELKKLAEAEFSENALNQPTVGLVVSFIALENTRQYAQYAALQTVHLYDVVRVIAARSGIDAKVRVTGYVYNCLTQRFDSVTLGELFELDASVSGYDITNGTVSGSKVIQGTMNGDRLRDMSINYAKIAQAAIDQLNANSITAVSARFGEIAAGSITTDQLYADLAQLVTLMVKSITAETIDTDELYAALADVILLRAQQINAENISVDKLAAQYAEIVALLVENLTAENVQADKLGAALASFVTMYAGVGEFDFATIQNLVAKAMTLEQASAESVYIKNLAVTTANLLSATLGKLILKGDDGGYYRVFVGADGNISTEPVQPTEGEIEAGQTAGGQQIVETNMNVADLNATNLQASSAVINEILTTALTAEKITAADALIASATIPALYTTSIQAIGAGIDLSSNQYIASVVEAVNNAQVTADNATIIQATSAPENPSDGALWLDIGVNPSVLRRWDGAQWLDVSATDELWKEVELSKTEIRQLTQEIALKVNRGDLETYLQLTQDGVVVGRNDSAYRVYIENGGYHVQQYDEKIMSLYKRTAYIPYMRYGTMAKSSYIADTISADGGIMTVRIDN